MSRSVKYAELEKPSFVLAENTSDDITQGASNLFFTTEEQSKLSEISPGADVTGTANVDAAGAVMETDFNASTILVADVDDTPTALTIGASTIVGRAAAGGIAALSAADVRTIINVEDGATADQTGAEIKSLYEAEADTNAFTDAEKSKLSGIEAGAQVTDATNVAAAGAVMESDTSTASMSFVIDDDTMASASNTTLATSESIKAYVDNAVSSGVVYKGGYDASTNTPDLDSSPIATDIGDMYTVTADGTFFTANVEVGDVLIAEAVNATTESDWTIVQKNLDADSIKTAYESNADTNAFTDAEQTKLAGIADGADVTTFASVDGVGAVMEQDYDANTILAADTDNTPAALTVGTNTIVGRAAGSISALTPTEVRSILNVEDGADVTDAANVDLAGAVMETDFDANTILAANADDTPLALTVTPSTFVGRKATGSISAMSAAEALAILNVEDGADVTDAANVDSAGAVMESDFDANTILAANADNTPLPLTMSDNSILAKVGTGNISSLGIAANTVLGRLSGDIVGISVIDDDSMATATANNIPSAESVRSFVLAVAGGAETTLLYTISSTDNDNGYFDLPGSPTGVIAASIKLDVPGGTSQLNKAWVDNEAGDPSGLTGDYAQDGTLAYRIYFKETPYTNAGNSGSLSDNITTGDTFIVNYRG